MLSEKKLIETIETALELKKGTIESGNEDWYSLWDSLGHLSILVKLDEVLNGQCAKINELSRATSIKAIKKVLRTNNLLLDWYFNEKRIKYKKNKLSLT